MAYIQPTGTIEFFGDLGLSPNYDDTFYFSSTSAKDTYFGGLTPIATAINCTYTRENRGFVRVQIAMSTLIYAQYMRFRNASFENKWFYAFVKSVNYVNNETTEVQFEIDYLMTWMGSFSLGNCLVEREHPISDAVGAHLMDECLSVGDYKIAYMDQITPFSPVLVISTSSIEDAPGSTTFEDAEPAYYKGNMVSGMAYKVFNMAESGGVIGAITAWFDHLVSSGTQKADAIACMRIVPEYCIPVADTGPVPLTTENGGTFTSQYSLTQIDGYTPRNNKLFSYPYCFYEVTNGEGASTEYRLEFFSTPLVPSFWYRGVCFDVCEVILIPSGYRGAALPYLYDEAMIMRQFPQASWNIDQYKAYLAQMSSGGGYFAFAANIASTLVGGAARAGAALESPNPAAAPLAGVSTALSLADQAAQLYAEHLHYQSLPPAVKGVSNANIMSAISQKRFTGYFKTIKQEYAIAIDRYFDMYGYKVATMKTPSMHNRPRWTFTKTQGCIVHGSLPADDAAAIENVFNRGCRFWNVGAVSGLTIGDYSGSNAPGA